MEILISIFRRLSIRLPQRFWRHPRLNTATLCCSLALTLNGMAVQLPAGAHLAATQTLVVNLGAEVPTLDPQKSEESAADNALMNLLEGLVGTDMNGAITPGVASRWENPTPTVWIFHLRPEARWSDGSPVTAQDFVYSWQRLGDPKLASPYASYLQDLQIARAQEVLSGKQPVSALGIKALDAHTFQVTLTTPIPYFVSMLTRSSLMPVQQATVERFGDQWTQPQHFVGNGPYRLKNWVVNEKIVLERNPQYWHNSATVIEQGTLLPISSEVADINRYRSGEIDITNNAIPPQLFAKLKQDLGSQVHVNPFLCTFYYELNNQKPPFNDPRVRAALKLTLDREVIAEKIMGQGQIPAYGFTPPFTQGAQFTPPAWASWSAEQRYQEARKLLAAAGYHAGNPLRFSLLYNTSDQNKQQAIAAASMWQKNLGAQVELQNQEWKTMLDSRHRGEYEIARATWCGDYNEPSAFLNIMLASNSNNTAFYRSAAFDQWMSQALHSTDATTRHTTYQQAETQLDSDSALIPVYYRVSPRLISPAVGGYSGKDPLDYIQLKYLYKLKQ